MISVDMFSLWSNQTYEIVKGVTEATNNIISYRNTIQVSKRMFNQLFEDIKEICGFWTGRTYVGVPKNDKVKDAFQLFYKELLKLLVNMKESKRYFERKIANEMLYRGTVYRYLGHTYQTDKVVEPIYDNIFVSWSKRPNNSYLSNKLCGTVTFITCEISEPLYGIDIDAIGCSKGDEHEVVFPTIKECIEEIRYTKEEEENEDDVQT